MIRDAMTATAAVIDLAARDPALPDLALVLDDERRSAAFGARTVIERVRYKPGASIVAAVRTPDEALWWCASYADPAKLDKSDSRARAHGAETRRLSERALAGAAHGDRLLAARIRRAIGDRDAIDRTRMLRYNPLRRLVVRAGDRAVKITAGDAAPVAAQALAATGAAVLAPERVGDGAWAYPWWGLGDAADPTLGTAPVLAAAGASLAAMHAVPRASIPLPVIDAAAAAAEAAEAIATLLPSLRARAMRLAAALAVLDGPRVPSHGDWSADQILTDGTEVRIIDLDRATLAPPEHDLGSYLAAGGDPAHVDGYLAAGGRVSPRALESWAAFGVLRRATEPFRIGDPSWPCLVEQALRRAESILQRKASLC
ncbi:phosphotransferase [Microbacterium sp. NPDC055903]